MKPYKGGVDDPNTKEDERFQTVGFFGPRGTGKGSDAEVHFSPETWKVTPTCSKTITAGCLPAMFAQNQGPDDVLLHEMVHAVRMMLGQSARNPTRIKGYDNDEEFFAILIANTYGSEKGQTIMRRDHHGGAALAKSLCTSEGFLGKGQRPLSMEQLENRLLLAKLVRENDKLCREYATRVTAKFNPIGEYLRNPFAYPYDPKLTFGLSKS